MMMVYINVRTGECSAAKIFLFQSSDGTFAESLPCVILASSRHRFQSSSEGYRSISIFIKFSQNIFLWGLCISDTVKMPLRISKYLRGSDLPDNYRIFIIDGKQFSVNACMTLNCWFVLYGSEDLHQILSATCCFTNAMKSSIGMAPGFSPLRRRRATALSSISLSPKTSI